ncbi:MAG: hypothetical protein Q4A46_02995 [Clostridia bacterium]|nr:hypothetical protein [Clostridia bacterium]
MNSLAKKIISVCIALVVLMSVSVTAFAADDILDINDGAKVNVGDRVKYTLYLADTKEEIIGFELRLFYDKDYLELDKKSLEFDKFDGVIYNTDLDNMIPINWTNISNPADFSKKAMFLSLEFRVLKEGETDISQFVSEMYGDDMTYLKSYTWTYDISVNDETVVSDQVPIISEDEDTLKNRQGSFINYLDGKGEENTPDKDNHPAVISYTQSVTDIVEVTKNSSSGGNSADSDFPLIPVIIGAAVLVVVLAVVGVLIVKKRDDNVDLSAISTQQDENNKNSD